MSLAALWQPVLNKRKYNTIQFLYFLYPSPTPRSLWNWSVGLLAKTKCNTVGEGGAKRPWEVRCPWALFQSPNKLNPNFTWNRFVTCISGWKTLYFRVSYEKITRFQQKPNFAKADVSISCFNFVCVNYTVLLLPKDVCLLGFTHI